MNYGICLLSSLPMRRDFSETSEMVNQLLFGDVVKILGDNPKWLFVETLDCGYKGWVDKKTIHFIEETEALKIVSKAIYFVEKQTVNVCDLSTQTIFPILKGSCFPVCQNTITLGDSSFEIMDSEGIRPIAADYDFKTLALSYLNTPYLWGGRSPFGLDCSGFVQVLYKTIGISLERDAGAQSAQGTTIDFIQEAQAGDLAFFENEEGRIIHVGMLLSSKEIIHASGKVKIDRFDHYGIFDETQQNYSHRLRIIKRYI